MGLKLLIDISSEVYIKGSIRPGSVFYFSDEDLSSSEPHYFIVLNINPLTDSTLLLVCSQSSQCEIVKRRRREFPETVVDISPCEYASFTRNSVVDCNNIFDRTIAQLAKKREDNVLKPKPPMPIDIVQKLRTAAINSDLVELDIKDMLLQK